MISNPKVEGNFTIKVAVKFGCAKCCKLSSIFFTFPKCICEDVLLFSKSKYYFLNPLSNWVDFPFKGPWGRRLTEYKQKASPMLFISPLAINSFVYPSCNSLKSPFKYIMLLLKINDNHTETKVLGVVSYKNIKCMAPIISSFFCMDFL